MSDPTYVRLRAAAKFSSVAEFRALLDDVGAETPLEFLAEVLYMACSRRVLAERCELVSLLLDSGADPRLYAYAGSSALHVLLGQPEFDPIRTPELAARLIAAGCDVNQVGNRHDTPLMAAVEQQVLRDSELGGLYDVFFGNESFEVDVPLRQGQTQRDIFALCDASYGRAELMTRVRQWDAAHGRG